jgi:hypothetical protein
MRRWLHLWRTRLLRCPRELQLPTRYLRVACSTDCRVSGHHYSFTITYGASYQSKNTGTFAGRKLTGSFKDTNGTVEHYTAKRRL